MTKPFVELCDANDDSTWGKSGGARLAADLRAEFPGVQGFSEQNLWYMRQFYLAYHDHPKLQPLVGEISWAKHLVVMAKCKDDDKEYFLDLLLFHRRLRCLVAIDLKIGEFEPESVGKMQS